MTFRVSSSALWYIRLVCSNTGAILEHYMGIFCWDYVKQFDIASFIYYAYTSRDLLAALIVLQELFCHLNVSLCAISVEVGMNQFVLT